MRTGKDYTVKIVKIVNPEDTAIIDLLRTEYAIGSIVDHPVIRKVYELRMMRQRLRVRGAILFMEYVDGMSLSDKEFRKPLDDILRIFTESARGLDAMHRSGFVHADLKPSNIMVDLEGVVKLIDLGQSSKMNEAKVRVQGTIDYMAPEQVQRGLMDRRTDVFGLGATLHRVLTGVPVQTDMNKTISLYAQGLVGKRVQEIDQGGSIELPACLARLVHDSCRYDPADRISDMPTFIERLDLARTVNRNRPIGTASAEPRDDDWSEGDQAPQDHDSKRQPTDSPNESDT
jgi:serine/threonine-protein kinase